MISKIENEAQYEYAIVLIEEFLQKATQAGRFNALTVAENEELSRLSLLVEQYEDYVLKIMPLPILGRT